MSDYLGRIITKNPQPPSPNSASGVWTLDEALQYSKAGKWPPGFQISRSVRLRSSAGGYFSRTLSTPTNSQARVQARPILTATLRNPSRPRI